MRRGWIVLALVAWMTAVHRLPAAEGVPEPVYTNKMRFRIPFRYDATEMQRLQAREVQLYVSTDRGIRWNIVDKVEPRREHFDFQAGGDGEYWFAVKTLDAFNRLHPQGSGMEPGLKVIVDATPPVLELTLIEVEPGKVELRWAAADDHLDPTKLRIEYRQPDAPEWQQVGVVPQASGQTTWAVPAGGVVAVRGSIGDTAGNTVNAEKQLNVHPAERNPQKGSTTEYRAPVAGSPHALPLTGASDLPGDLSSQPEPANPHPETGNRLPGPPALTTDQDFFTDPDSGPRIQPRAKNDLVSDSPSSRPSIVPKSYVPTNASASSTSGPSADDFAPAPSTTPQPKEEGPKTILVNNHDFQIGYRVDDVGPSGVGKVELFITQDDGRKWYRYGTDPDHHSPFAVRVPEDGVYGFEIRVKNGAGVGEEPPRPGDKPSIIVTVDTTPPAVQLHAPQIGRGQSRNKVLIRWTASDAHFGRSPISLEYATDSAGPWQRIGDWQENSGRYVWALDKGLPGKVYLRVTAKDEAGNTAQSVSPEPLVIDFTRPTARIVDIEAKTSSAPRD